MQLYERMIKSFIAESQVWTYLLVRLFIISHVGEIILEIKLLEEVRMKNRENNNMNSRKLTLPHFPK